MHKEGQPTLTFRYRGPMNWKKIYKGSLQFFKDKECDISETRYKDKTNEFEGEFVGERIYDMYNKFEFKVNYKAFDMVPSQKEGIFNGKLMLQIETTVLENYDISNPGGKKVLFDEDSWVHKIYKKITARDRGENIQGEALVTAQSYIEWLKKECNMDMAYG